LDDSAYHRSAANIGDFIDVSSGPSLHQTAIPSYLSQPEQILPSIEGFSHALTSSTSRRTDEGFPTRTKAQRSQSYAQQQMPAPTVLGYTPVMPRLVELDEHCDGHLTKRRRIANPAYESSNEMPLVTSRALPLEASGMSPSRVQWLDSGSLPMRQTHTNSIYVPELDSGSHQQRLGVLDRPQTTTGLAYHRRPRLRYTEHVYPDLPDQEPWNEVLRRPNGDFVDDIENRSPPFGRWNRGTQAPLDSRHPRFTTHHSEQLYESSVDRDRLSVFVHGPDHSSHSTQIISKASLRDDDQMIADPRGVHMVEPLRNTGQPPRFVRASEDDSFVHTDISTRTQLPSGEATGHQRFARENLVGAQGYAYYQQRPRTELPSEKYYPSPIPLLPGPTQRRNLVTSEYRQVEVHGLRQSYDKPQGIAAREQPVSWTHLNSRSEPLASVKVSDAPAWITSRAEQRR